MKNTQNEIIAWGDESMKFDKRKLQFYLLGAYIEDESDTSLLSDLSGIKPDSAPKLHWRDMSTKSKKLSIRKISDSKSSHLIVSAIPLVQMRQERARKKCLMRMLYILEKEFSVDRYILESRAENQDKTDVAIAEQARNCKAIDKIRVDHQPGKSEKRLWVPDQVLGAYGDSLKGENFTSFIKDNVFIETIQVK